MLGCAVCGNSNEKNASGILSYLEVGVEKDINAHTRGGAHNACTNSWMIASQVVH